MGSTIIEQRLRLELGDICVSRCVLDLRSSFSQTHKVDKVGVIANIVFRYMCSSLCCVKQLMLVNVKIEIKGYKRIRL